MPSDLKGKAVLLVSNKYSLSILLTSTKNVGASGVIVHQHATLQDNCPLPVIGLSGVAFKTLTNLIKEQRSPILQFSSTNMLVPNALPILNDMNTL